MTTPLDDHRPLLTETDMLARIRTLLAPACHPAQLWVLLLDSDGYQSPVMMPLEDRPRLPDQALLDGLTDAVATLIAETMAGPGQALFVVERLGPFGITDEDRCWATDLADACERAELPLAGMFLLSPGGVARLAG